MCFIIEKKQGGQQPQQKSPREMLNQWLENPEISSSPFIAGKNGNELEETFYNLCKVHYDFVEVMACPGGCVGGGGQPIDLEDEERYGVRGQRLYDLDRANPIRFSHENPDVQKLYDEFLDSPLSERAEELLHTDHTAWNMPNQI